MQHLLEVGNLLFYLYQVFSNILNSQNRICHTTSKTIDFICRIIQGISNSVNTYGKAYFWIYRISCCLTREKIMDCVAGEALRRQILYTLLVEVAATYKRDPTNTEQIKSLIDQINMLVES
jgi:hypothetical protein